MKPAAQAQANAPADLELLSVKVNDQDFAIDIMAVREIRGWVVSTPLPHAPAYVKGMVNLRGMVMPIVSLADRLNLVAGEPGSSSVVVVVECQGRIVGLLVDAVSDILKIDPNLIQPSPDVGSPASVKVVRGLVIIETTIVSILSIPDIMPDLSAALTTDQYEAA